MARSAPSDESESDVTGSLCPKSPRYCLRLSAYSTFTVESRSPTATYLPSAEYRAHIASSASSSVASPPNLELALALAAPAAAVAPTSHVAIDLSAEALSSTSRRGSVHSDQIAPGVRLHLRHLLARRKRKALELAALGADDGVAPAEDEGTAEGVAAREGAHALA